MCQQLADESDGLDAARGIVVAFLLSMALWGLVIGAILLSRSCQSAPSGPARPALASTTT
ncbi:hypothetical protein P9A47_gp51 [Xanthomonas phage Elanor]|uniref:Uncharacterized protein n=1 Tax=Xanthomonas phage Elanor TaxID=2939127 RepID=A0A9E7J694_9CAUD|nr:hypothetical protein P9A47_gp51 [Xanthomonas phage Elanor]URA07019.1 hypothetical protein Elanor_BL40051 [Xanthomonas phage Elanor]